MTYNGNLLITSENVEQYKDLTSVRGGLAITVTANLGGLTSVDLDLFIEADAELGALTGVGGDLVIEPGMHIYAPNLTSVGGDLYDWPKKKPPEPGRIGFNLKSLSSIGGGSRRCPTKRELQ